jgi:protein ImuB
MRSQPKWTGTPCWLAVRLPHFALDLVTRGQVRHDTPVAISDTLGRRECLIDCNPAATKAGIRSGLPTAAALGILDSLRVLPRDRARECEALQGLAAWCYQYSNQVSLPSVPAASPGSSQPGTGAAGTGRAGDDRIALWLEAAASGRLFGPPAELGSRLECELAQLGYHARTGSAPTPEAAWIAAGETLHITSSGDIRRQLGPLPLDRLHLEPGRLRDLLRLPRKSVTRRFGPATADYLDRMIGTRPDPRPGWHPPETFTRRLELPVGIGTSQALVFPLKRLLEELGGVLRGGDTAVQSLHLALRHEDHHDTRLKVGMQSPAQDPERLLRLVRERLERLRLPQAVREIRLTAPRLLPFAAGQRSLFHDSPAEQHQDIERLAERLQARLGGDAICGVTGVADHRPEYSWRSRALNERPDCAALAHRPTWLLQQPQRCDIARYRILAGPERIESGWWDGHDCRRDYFVVRDTAGSILWAFREYKPRRGWFLHGVFG